MRFWIIWCIVVIIMLFSSVDLFFDSTMSMHMVLQPIFFILIGFVSGLKSKFNFGLLNAFGITGLILFISNYIFWMLPRSLDLTLIDDFFDKFCHICFIVNGFILNKSFSRMPFFIRASFGINFLSMFSALGLFYFSYENQACTSYPFIQQKETGLILLILSIPLWILHLIWIFTSNYNVSKIKNLISL